MKLLFDQNLSPKLVVQLLNLFPESAHLRDFGFSRAADPVVWELAAAHDYVIVSKDDDFHHLSFLRGAPPKVIGIGLGNCSTAEIEELLRLRFNQITSFGCEPTAAFLPLP